MVFFGKTRTLRLSYYMTRTATQYVRIKEYTDSLQVFPRQS